MRTLQIRKKTAKVWQHIDSFTGAFILSKLRTTTVIENSVEFFFIVEIGGAKRFRYEIQNITVYDDTTGGVAETFTSMNDLMIRLEALNYIAFENITSGGGGTNQALSRTVTNISIATQGQTVFSVPLNMNIFDVFIGETLQLNPSSFTYSPTTGTLTITNADYNDLTTDTFIKIVELKLT